METDRAWQRTLSENSQCVQEELWIQPLVLVNPPELQGCWMNPGFVSHWLRAAPGEHNPLTFPVSLMWQAGVLLLGRGLRWGLCCCLGCCELLLLQWEKPGRLAASTLRPLPFSHVVGCTGLSRVVPQPPLMGAVYAPAISCNT